MTDSDDASSEKIDPREILGGQIDLTNPEKNK